MNLKLLDHGYVNLIESWGSDERIIESARMSTDGAFRGWGPHVCNMCADSYTPGTKENAASIEQCPKCNGTTQIPGDEKLLAYLYNHKHHTPFEMAGLTIEVQAPIFVFRQWHRHRTQSYNELSARYTEMPDLFYVPTVERLMMVNDEKVNKQAGGSGPAMTQGVAENAQWIIKDSCISAYGMYRVLLAQGVASELARTVLPVGQYSRMRASANLRNWLAFLTLRLDPHAQWEIRMYARAVGSQIAINFPRTWELFIEGVK